MSADVVFSFDTTGSMSACLGQLRKQIQVTARQLFKDIPDLRIGIVAHGDYCDARTSYVIRILDHTSMQWR